MKHIALLALSILSFTLHAQTLYMKSGSFTPAENVKTITDFSTWSSYQLGEKTYCIVQFKKSTSIADRNTISQETGIQFLDYFPTWAFLAAIPNGYNVSSLANYNIRSIIPYAAAYKIAPKLMQRPLPDWMNKGNGRFELLLEAHHALDKESTTSLLKEKNIQLISWKDAFHVVVEIDESELQTIASYAWVKYMQTTSAPAVLENLTERSNHRVNTIDASYATGLHYDGTGVSVAVGDDGTVGPHIDFAGRVTDHTTNNNGTHADHVSGIVAGGGNFDPVTSGNARGADLHIYSYYDNLTNAPTDYTTNNIRITSNSLGQGCNIGYDADAQNSDYLIDSKPSLMSVHSAGNSGNGTCGGVPQGYFTITGGYKAGKNVITVGNVTNSDVIASSSSRGPSEDGRLKPEIVAVGTDVYSTQPDNTYDSFTGTSMACPGVAGTLASLWQSYRDNNSGTDPASDLMKALVMNSADDLGAAGPDFIYGYGRINARRAYKAMSNNQYFVGSLANGFGDDYFINVPPNTRQLKVMLYWNDFEGNPASSVALVNDLNLSVQEPSGNVIDPWVLDNTPTVAALSAPAIRGVDNINNVEQVTLDSVIAGPCVVSVYGNNIPLGPQKYVLVYEFITDQITLTYPQGGESFANSQKERIRWDAYGNNGGTFKLEYSANAGTTWNTLAANIPGSQRYYDWTPPNTLNTGQMKMRITRGAISDESDTLFTVFDVPKNLTVDTACGTIFHLKWDAIPFATSYIIYSMGPKYMTQIGTSTTNSFVISTGVSVIDTFYYAVSAVNSLNGANGLRTIAYQKNPGEVNCADNSYNYQTILPFKDGYTCATTAPMPVKVKLINLGLRPIVNLPIYYQVNANPVVAEFVPGPIPVGDTAIFTFATPVNMSLPGTYNVTTWTSVYTDIVVINDTSEATATVSIPTVLNAPTVEDFEGPIFPPTGWRVIDADTSIKWQKTLCLVDPTGFNTHTAYMDFFNYNNTKQIDDLETAQYDLTGVIADTVLMTFDISNAFRSSGSDSLQLLVSDDCAVNFTPTTYYKGGIPLATAGMMNTIFSPTLTTQWRNDRLDLTSYIGKKIFVRFRATNMQGNNLFIDNINLMLKNAWPLGTSNFNDELLTVYPNPSDGNYTLEFNANESKEIRYTIYNIAGQRIRQNRLSISAGKTKAALNISGMAGGMYMLELNDRNATKKIKLIKY
jgi:hypothetical protein